MPPRLATSVWVGALIRRVMAQGDFATVLKRGEPTAGAVLVIHRHRDTGRQSVYGRVTGASGESTWESLAEDSAIDDQRVADYIARQRRFDPDIWMIELDIVPVQRLIDVLTDSV